MKLDRLIREHHDAVLRYLRRRTTDPQEVEDAAAETFLVAWRRLDAVPADARPWLLGVARKALARQWRSARRRRALLARLRLLYEPVAPVVEGVDRPIGRALERLSARDREALMLVVVEDMTSEDAALVLGVPASTFRSRLQRARQRLAHALEETELEERAAETSDALDDAKETT